MQVEQMSELIELQKAYAQLRKQHFFEHVLFSYQWWIFVFLMIGLWTIWTILVEKRRLNIILLVGLITSSIAFIFDDIGVTLALWAYPYEFAYVTSHMSPVDLAIIPVSYMLLYQYANNWKPYILTLILLTLFGAFIAEPTFVKLDMYRLLQWQHWYSLPFYILIGIFVKWLVDKIEKNHV